MVRLLDLGVRVNLQTTAEVRLPLSSLLLVHGFSRKRSLTFRNKHAENHSQNLYRPGRHCITVKASLGTGLNFETVFTVLSGDISD